MDTDAVILCGGLGTRLRAVTGDKPKALVDVNGQPFMDILLEYLKLQGIRRVVLCVGYQADHIKEYYRQHSFGLAVELSRETEPLGTGGAVRLAKGLIKSQDFFILNGDSFCNVNLSSALKFHNDHHALATQVLVKSYGGQDVGTVIIDDDKRILHFREKTKEALPSGVVAYMNTGVCCFDRRIFDFFPDQRKFSLEYDVYPRILSESFYGFPTDAAFWDVGTPERLEQAKNLLSNGKQVTSNE